MHASKRKTADFCGKTAPQYIVRKLTSSHKHEAQWIDNDKGCVAVSDFRKEGSKHRPITHAKLFYSDEGLHGFFMVQDSYVRCVNTEINSAVHKDSCVEFFVRPRETAGYFNFEFNCGGAVSCSYIKDSTRIAGGFKSAQKLTESELCLIKISHSMPRVVEPEITKPTVWLLDFVVPFSIFEKYLGPLGTLSEQIWSANFYKCGDETSHPHWASWASLTERNFHLPECFGIITFE
ncbi:MAG: carbohydrate-binding family 9-like protein [Nitrospirae bacterium]|nr:carbohydrate-binding family 9-like protein [Nitrospirota bacterium]